MKWIIPLIFLSLLVSCHTRPNQKKLSSIMKLPAFRVISIDSCKCINTEYIATGSPSIFIYFDPDCEHCQRETKSILAHIDQLRKANLYWITNGDLTELKQFCQNFRLDTFKNVMIGRDYEYTFYRAFLPPSTPYIAIYNSHKSLVRLYKGEPDLNSIVAAIRN